VPRDASKAQIKKAYKKLSKIYHPDKNPGDQKAKDKFVELSDGRQILIKLSC
jgi:DnaJ-related protein SCJ1